MHPFGDLSAYLDGALSAEARASIEAHLDSCALCRTRLAELRTTARLIAALPTPLPTRSLVPRVAVPFWLAPLRTASTFASAAAIFLFIATAAFASFPRMQSAAPAAAPNAVSAPQASRAGGAAATAPSSQDFTFSAPTAAPGAASNERTTTDNSTAPAGTAKEVGRQDSVGPSDAAGLTRLSRGAEPQPSTVLLSPWFWLGLAIVFGALSLILGRLRSA